MEAADCFTNHQLELRFLWSLYRRPIVNELSAALGGAVRRRILNLGSGPFFELDSLGVPPS